MAQDRCVSSEPWGRAFSTPHRRILQTKHHKSLNFSEKKKVILFFWLCFHKLLPAFIISPTHFPAPKWHYLPKAQIGHQAVVWHGGCNGLRIRGVATGHAPQVALRAENEALLIQGWALRAPYQDLFLRWNSMVWRWKKKRYPFIRLFYRGYNAISNW